MSSEPPILSYVSRYDDVLRSRRNRVIRFGTEKFLTLCGAVMMLALFVGIFLLFHRSVLTGIIGGLVGLVFIPFMAVYLRRRQRIGGMRVVQYIEQAVRLNLPLPEFLRIAAISEQPRPARQLRGISDSLIGGISLGDAVRGEVPELPPRIGGLLRSAEASGTLRPSLARIVDEFETHAKQEAARPSVAPLTYVSLLCVLLIVCVSFIAIFVVPKFIQLGQDFGVESLPLTYAVRLLDSPGTTLIVGIVHLAAILFLLGSLVSGANTIMGRHPRSFDPLRGLRDRIVWWIPFAGGMVRDGDYADLCRSVADALRAARPMDVALQDAAQPHLNAIVQRRLDRWRTLHIAGQTVGRSARDAGMPSLIAGMLPDTADTGSVAAAFEFLAGHYRTRSLRTRQWLYSLLPTLITFVFAAIVFAVSYLLYTSAWRLMDAVAPYKVGL